MGQHHVIFGISAVAACIVGGGLALVVSGGMTHHQQQQTNSATMSSAATSTSTKQVGAILSAKAQYDRWQKHYLLKDQAQHLYVNSSDTSDSRTAISEAQGYGLYITVLAAQKGLDKNNEAQFESLYQYYLAHRSKKSQLMAWHQKYNPNNELVEHDESSATDGDLYIAYALILAANQYPDKRETYTKQARAILSDILKYNYNDDKQILTTGNWVTKDSNAYQIFRSSDVIPMFFEKFASFTQDNRWEDINASMTSKLKALSQQNDTGLVSDMVSVKNTTPAPAKIGSDDDMLYGYNAIRVPMVLLDTSNNDASYIVNRILQFFNSQKDMLATYALDGRVTGNYHSDLQAEMINYAAKRQSQQYNKLYQRTTEMLKSKTSNYNYYTDTLGLIAALQDK